MSVTDYRTVSSSNPATLVTEVKKLITAGWQPLSGHVAGSALNLSAVVVDGVSQQWQKSTDSGVTWNNISGATNTTFTIAAAASGDAGQYRLLVRGNNGSGGAGDTTGYGYSTVTTVTVN